ncbi:DUF4267 domain-containing protein [Nocardia sp. NPDC127606]|uniref:DUF4267 domain-containing protein n=1 Tax=Nocardia sp. NPDC127606 TaxID=3345406 RepID=UPI003628F685
MLTPLAYGLAIFLIVFVLFIGARFLLTPESAADGFGVPAKPDGDAAYLTVKGLRDFTSGVIGLALTGEQRPPRSASISPPQWLY